MKKVSKTLSGHLEMVTKSVDRINNFEGKVPQIEWDILLSNLRNMYEESCLLSLQGETENGSSTDEGTIPTTAAPIQSAPVVAAAVAEALVDAATETATPDEQADVPTAVEETPSESSLTNIPEKESEPESEPEPIPEPEAAKEEQTVAPSLSPLMVDTDTPPVYAEEETVVEPILPANEQPTMEEIEGQRNDTLFNEENVTVETPAQAEELQQPAQPQTLWDKLQESKHTPSLGETVSASKTISDLFVERNANEHPADVEKPATPVMQPTAPAPPQQSTYIEEPIQQPTVVAPEQPAPPTPVEPPATPIHQSSLFDYLKKGEAPQPTTATLADSLGGNKNDALDQKIAAARVSDLRTIININDKFRFMNELFHNNMKGYNDFILHLNTIADRDEAMAYVNNVAGQYEWDQNSMAVQTFFQIFDRKF